MKVQILLVSLIFSLVFVGCMGPIKKEIQDFKREIQQFNQMGRETQAEMSYLRESIDDLTKVLNERLPEKEMLENISARLPSQENLHGMNDATNRLSDNMEELIEEWRNSPFGRRHAQR